MLLFITKRLSKDILMRSEQTAKVKTLFPNPKNIMPVSAFSLLYRLNGPFFSFKLLLTTRKLILVPANVLFS